MILDFKNITIRYLSKKILLGTTSLVNFIIDNINILETNSNAMGSKVSFIDSGPHSEKNIVIKSFYIKLSFLTFAEFISCGDS